MKFLCMGYFDREKMDARPKSEVDALMQQCQPFLEKFYKSGHVVIDAGLEMNGKYLRRVNGKVTITDGPFTETKEMVGGAFLVETADMDEAIRVASLHPAIQIAAGEQFGWNIEIRPIRSFENCEFTPYGENNS